LKMLGNFCNTRDTKKADFASANFALYVGISRP
jgi:hypothetical protein